MHPRTQYHENPNKTALIFEPEGHSLSYGELEERANRAAQLFRSLGIATGEKVAFCLENCPAVFEICWGAQRSGIDLVPISSRLTADEINYILQDSGSRLLLTSDYLEQQLLGIAEQNKQLSLYKTGLALSGFENWESALDEQSDETISDESAGTVMFYSSGTTGRPKGVVPAPQSPDVEGPHIMTGLVQHLLSVSENSVYLCPSPLYHAAPLAWSMAMQRMGATTVVMEKFDPQEVLALIEKHRITCGQFVPTHFVRMLKLPKEERGRRDLSSLDRVVHAAAPCPVPIKAEMIEWWGPIINEYYSGSEGAGMTFITSPEWLEHRGSVGRPVMGTIHVCGEDGEELPQGGEGQVFFEGGSNFSYHNDPKKTAEARNKEGWTSLGDVGRVDEDGYLYLTDRKSFMIISGGVNIYPQEIENHLITHDDVADVAVIGAPDADMGEKVVAVVQPAKMVNADEALAEKLIIYCRTALSGIKTPRQIDFRATLPRTETGKLFKRELRDEYWQDQLVQ